MQLTTQNRKTHQEIGNLLIYCSVLSVVNLISDLIVLSFYLLLCFVFVLVFCEFLRWPVCRWVLLSAAVFFSLFLVFYKLYFHVCRRVLWIAALSCLQLSFGICCCDLWVAAFSCLPLSFFNLPLCSVVLLLHVKCCVVLFRVVFCDPRLCFIICRYDLQFRPAVRKWPLSISFLKTRICIKGI